MQGQQEQRFTVRGGRTLAGKRWPGTGRPTIALHGWLDNANSFDLLAAAMPELDLLALDFAGHGHSDPRAGDVGYWGWLDVQDVIAVADALGWVQFNVIAHSMGAEYSTQLAGLYPDRLVAQVCIDGWVEALDVDGVLDGVVENLNTCIVEAPGNLRTYDSIDAMAERLAGAQKLSLDAARRLVERGNRRLEHGFAWATEPRIRRTHTQRQTPEVVMALARRTRAPTLLLRATDGQDFFHHSIELVRDLMPMLEERVIEGPHHLHLSDALPDVVAEIRAFFASLGD